MNSQRRAANFAIFAAAAAASAVAIWVELPHEHKVSSLAVFLVKLLPFIFATEAIAWLDPAWLSRQVLRMLVVIATFATFFVYFVPKLFFYSYVEQDFDTYYYYVLTLTPLIILSLALAFRLGGGAPGPVRRMSYAMLLLMLSGSEDLAFRLLNHLGVPPRWTWAYHIEVFLGHFPTSTEAYVFLGVHLILAALVLTVPGRWFRRGGPAPVGAAGEGEPAAGTVPSTGAEPAAVPSAGAEPAAGPSAGAEADPAGGVSGAARTVTAGTRDTP